MTEQEQQPSPKSEKVQFSFATMKDGEVYGIQDGELDFVVQLKSTWLKVGTYIQSLRNIAKNQDRRIKELLAQNEELNKTNTDLADRLDALRTNHRKLVAARVEQQMADLGYLTTPKEDPT